MQVKLSLPESLENKLNELYPNTSTQFHLYKSISGFILKVVRSSNTQDIEFYVQADSYNEDVENTLIQRLVDKKLDQLTISVVTKVSDLGGHTDDSIKH